jgi:hypothetical protein
MEVYKEILILKVIKSFHCAIRSEIYKKKPLDES